MEQLSGLDFDWLWKMRTAADAEQEAPAVPLRVASKLWRMGFARPAGFGRWTITGKGRGRLFDRKYGSEPPRAPEK